jgi:CRISPR type I-E-associated protein CasB/Cse2
VASWPGGDSRSPRDFGAHLRAIRYRPDAAGRSREDEDAGVERRFAALLDASREALPHHLRHLVRLLDDRAPEAGIDYRQLAIDITKWDDPDRNVQVRWARGFWSWRPGDATENTGAVPGAADQEPKDNGNEEE